ncbi:MAG: DUF488 domain-containing protein [Thermoleophilia bacterium]
MDVRTKRVYEAADPADGRRVLADRVWPRGMTKERVRADAWLKDVAPSTGLRTWFGHDRSKWEPSLKEPLTLLCSAHDSDCNQAVALREYLLALPRVAPSSARR